MKPHKFSTQLSFLENLLLSIIAQYPNEKPERERLNEALRALVNEGPGIGTSGYDDETLMWRMMNEYKKDKFFFGPHRAMYPKHLLPKHKKPRSQRQLAREVLGLENFKGYNANVDRLRKAFAKNFERLVLLHSPIGDEWDVQKTIELNGIQRVLDIFKTNGIKAEISATHEDK